MAILEVKGLTRRFGGLVAVNNLDFSVAQGEILAVIGPNGAGKSTAFGLVSGFLRPDAGRVSFDGRDITGLAPHRIVEQGLARSFQIVEIFADMTVVDAVTAAALLRLPLRKAVDRANEILVHVGLASKHDENPGNLSLQDRKLLELAKCLATDPKLILLDEVMAGLTLAEAEVPVGIIRELRAAGITFVLGRTCDADRHEDRRSHRRSQLRREGRGGHAGRDRGQPSCARRLFRRGTRCLRSRP